MKDEVERTVGFKTVGAICLTVLSVVGFIVWGQIERTKVEAEKAVEAVEIEQREATERTEERSQFWQKMIPWGSDESESSDA